MTWFVFKTVQWIFPFALLLQASGLEWLRHRQKGVAAVAIVAAVSLAPAHLPWSRKLGAGTTGIAVGERPLATLEDTLKGIADLPPGNLVLIGLPHRVSAFRARYTALFASPRPVILDQWGNSFARTMERARGSEAVSLLAAAPPFDREARTDLGGGYALLTAVDRPRLVQVIGRVPVVGDPERGGLAVPLARSRTKLLLLASRPGPLELILRIEPAGGASTSVVRCHVVPGTAGGVRFRQAMLRAPARRLRIVRGSDASVRFEAKRGLNAIVLTPEGPPQRLVDVAVRTAGLSDPEGSIPARSGPPDD